MRKIQIKSLLIFFFLTFSAQAAIEDTALAVWVNEAIVATYTYNYKNFLQRQKEIAKYFSAEGWTAYSTALMDSKLPEAVKNNAYFVSSVATAPPVIKTISTSPAQWEASMPLLVLYKNPQYEQRQHLAITLRIGRAPAGQGVRGYVIKSLQSTVRKPACKCEIDDIPPNSTIAPTSPPDENQSKPTVTQ